MYEKLEALPWVYAMEMEDDDPLFPLLIENFFGLHRYAWLDSEYIIIHTTLRQVEKYDKIQKIHHVDIIDDSYYLIARPHISEDHKAYRMEAILGDIDTCNIEDIEHTTADELFVEEEYRRRGYATQIMKHALNLFDIDSLRVSTWNDAAINCYRKLGFLYPGDEGYPSIPKVEGVPEFTGILPNSKLAIMLRKDKCN